jgi:hypothetical protein
MSPAAIDLRNMSWQHSRCFAVVVRLYTSLLIFSRAFSSCREALSASVSARRPACAGAVRASRLEFGHVLVAQLLGREALALRGLRNLLAVLVRAGHEEHLRAAA